MPLESVRTVPSDAPTPESRWRHYKGGLYRVLHVARHSETEERLVVYVAEGKPEVWVRPLSMWVDPVDGRPRFAPLEGAGTEKPLRVLVCGSRDWKADAVIERELRGLPSGSVLISSGARGADRLAVRLAWNLGIRVEEYHSEPGRGTSARTQRMLQKGHPDVVWAFHKDIEHSEGTADLVQHARAAGVPVRVISG
jgi:hypothetical protein